MRWVHTIIRGIILAVLLLLCAALFYVLIIMGDSPQADVVSRPVETAGPLTALPQGPYSFMQL